MYLFAALPDNELVTYPEAAIFRQPRDIHSRFQVIDLAGDLERSAQAEQNREKHSLLAPLASRLLLAIDRFADTFPRERGRFPLTADILEQPGLAAAQADVESALAQVAQALEPLA